MCISFSVRCHCSKFIRTHWRFSSRETPALPVLRPLCEEGIEMAPEELPSASPSSDLCSGSPDIPKEQKAWRPLCGTSRTKASLAPQACVTTVSYTLRGETSPLAQARKRPFLPSLQTQLPMCADSPVHTFIEFLKVQGQLQKCPFHKTPNLCWELTIKLPWPPSSFAVIKSRSHHCHTDVTLDQNSSLTNR